MVQVNISLKQNKEGKKFSVGLFLFIFESFFSSCFLISIFLLKPVKPYDIKYEFTLWKVP